MITIYLDSSSSTPLYMQLYDHMRQLIINGSLEAHAKLPSRRQLANHLKVSEMTVMMGYEQLLAEGYIYAQKRTGYYVESLPSLKIMIPPKKPHLDSPVTEAKHYLEFKTNVIARDAFPYDLWAKCEKQVITDTLRAHINEKTLYGYAPLREEIAKYLYNYRAIEVTPEDIIITSGSETLVPLIKGLMSEHSCVGLENPGYPKLSHMYQSLSIPTTPIRLDGNGMAMDALEASHVTMIHITPSHQFPTTEVMSVKKRMALLEWANQRDDRWILEDDYDSEFRFSGKPIPALRSLDHHGKVIYFNSFSKSIAPSIRIGFVVIPSSLRQKMRLHSWDYSCPVSMIQQMTLKQFMADSHFERHLNRMRNLYKAKRDYLMTALMRLPFDDMFRIVGSDAGLHFLMVFEAISESRLIACAKEKGVLINGLSQYMLSPIKDTPATIVMGYSDLEEKEIDDMISRLNAAWTPLFRRYLHKTMS
ncbi:MAG: PLP-dependent aminotransferase family protein [Candidatus Izemoplasmatales bacterium]|nr:PLP-dependent aminotransferase family protein [Candidatus Izemoplasmatales bacterium]